MDFLFFSVVFLLPRRQTFDGYRSKIYFIPFLFWSIWIILTSLGIEATQFIFNIGVTDIDDVILNIIGGSIGLLLLHQLKKKVFP